MCLYNLIAHPSDKDFKDVNVEFSFTRSQVQELSNAFDFLRTTKICHASLPGDTQAKVFEKLGGSLQLKTDMKFKPMLLSVDRQGLVTGQIECAHWALSYSFEIGSISELCLQFRIPSVDQFSQAHQEAIRCLFGQEFNEEECRKFFQLGNMPRHHFREILAAKISSQFPLS